MGLRLVVSRYQQLLGFLCKFHPPLHMRKVTSKRHSRFVVDPNWGEKTWDRFHQFSTFSSISVSIFFPFSVLHSPLVVWLRIFSVTAPVSFLWLLSILWQLFKSQTFPCVAFDLPCSAVTAWICLQAYFLWSHFSHAWDLSKSCLHRPSWRYWSFSRLICCVLAVES